jgi:hypothetical protein
MRINIAVLGNIYLIFPLLWLVVMKKLVLPRVFIEFPSTGTAFSMAFLIGTMLTAHVVVLGANAQGPPPGTPGSQSDGRLASLADRWVRWIVSIDTSIEPNPFTTIYDGDCSQLIQGNMMFLVGQAGVGGTPNHGRCIVPSGTSIFFPVINFIVADCQSNQQNGRPEGLCTFDIQTPALGQPFGGLMEQANSFINGVTGLVAELDGVPLEIVRVQSPPGGFGVRVSEHNALFGELGPFFGPFGTVSLHAVVDGYWVLLPPLSPGIHTLTFGACSQDFGCQTNTYTLEAQ